MWAHTQYHKGYSGTSQATQDLPGAPLVCISFLLGKVSRKAIQLIQRVVKLNAGERGFQ